MDMVWTLGKDPLVQKPDHDEGEWNGRKENILWVCVWQEPGKDEWKTTQKHPAAFQLVNFGGGKDIRAAEAFILICAWLRRVGGGEKQIKLKDPQSDIKKMAFCNIFVDLQSFPGFIFITKPQKTVRLSLLRQQKFQNSCHTFQMFKWRAWTNDPHNKPQLSQVSLMSGSKNHSHVNVTRLCWNVISNDINLSPCFNH